MVNMRAFFIVLLLLIPCFAQETLKPVSFALAVKGDTVFRDALWRELRQNRNVMVASRKPDFDIYAAVTEITEGERSYGYAVALLVVVDGRYDLSIHSGRSPDALARYVAGVIEEKYFRPKR